MKPLTERELTCLRWAAVGKTSWEMGAILGLTERTVNFHVHNACRKLGVHGRQAAITTALRSGLLPLLSEPSPAPAKTDLPDALEMLPAQPSPVPRPAPRPSTKP
ncbi:helix-turn-helix domain-containing protein [Pollutimonas harenae]|uniref:Helix-turn-helix domain-containing protein n=1 Tax=Pollutimonas harenae TaxID=657015 RepID=A0A853GPV6_9BURK|nr:helix-turn-helix domain-containing protein [Pollutimonas harenae]NYT85068.1 helix-turn-helix domain-containing protein [Pollutimonas harenae]TEA72549.1 helix-turn-helix transcriptional regulator [Pollutimonas harenae]